MASYDKKIIVSGKNVEVYTYTEPVLYGYTDNKKTVGTLGRGGGGNTSEKEKAENRQKTLNRARANLVRLVNSNFEHGKSRFVTLTFKENITDLKMANYEFKKFIQRFDYYMRKEVYSNDFKLKYSAVVEFQKRGAIHYHCVFYNLPKKLDLPRCTGLWGHGSFNCKRIDKIDDVGNYITKYMTKDNGDERLKGQKMYFNSRNLNKPKTIKKPDDVEVLANTLQSQGATVKYANEYNVVVNGVAVNTISYTKYTIK